MKLFICINAGWATMSMFLLISLADLHAACAQLWLASLLIQVCIMDTLIEFAWFNWARRRGKKRHGQPVLELEVVEKRNRLILESQRKFAFVSGAQLIQQGGAAESAKVKLRRVVKTVFYHRKILLEKEAPKQLSAADVNQHGGNNDKIHDRLVCMYNFVTVDIGDKASMDDAVACFADFSAPKSFSYEGVREWEFDVLEYDKEELLWIAREVFIRTGFIEDFGIDQSKLITWLRLLPQYYLENPYHNLYHGIFVMHAAFVLLYEMANPEVLERVDVFALLIASLCHDLGHPGVNNRHIVATFPKLSKLYDNVAVLEHCHIALCFRMLQRPDSDIIAHLDADKQKRIRASITECILATDMSLHFPIREEFVAMHSENQTNSTTLMKMIIKCADIANSSKPWAQFGSWNEKIAIEMWEQGDRELRLGMEPIAMMNRVSGPSSSENSLNFIDFLAQPLYKSWSEFCPAGALCLDYLKINQQTLKGMVEANTAGFASVLKQAVIMENVKTIGKGGSKALQRSKTNKMLRRASMAKLRPNVT